MRTARRLPLDGEKLIPFKDLPAKLPVRISYPTLVRWADIGFKGVFLDSLRIGGRIYTSIEAWNRFVEQTQPE